MPLEFQVLDLKEGYCVLCRISLDGLLGDERCPRCRGELFMRRSQRQPTDHAPSTALFPPRAALGYDSMTVVSQGSYESPVPNTKLGSVSASEEGDQYQQDSRQVVLPEVPTLQRSEGPSLPHRAHPDHVIIEEGDPSRNSTLSLVSQGGKVPQANEDPISEKVQEHIVPGTRPHTSRINPRDPRRRPSRTRGRRYSISEEIPTDQAHRSFVGRDNRSRSPVGPGVEDSHRDRKRRSRSPSLAEGLFAEDVKRGRGRIRESPSRRIGILDKDTTETEIQRAQQAKFVAEEVDCRFWCLTCNRPGHYAGGSCRGPKRPGDLPSFRTTWGKYATNSDISAFKDKPQTMVQLKEMIHQLSIRFSKYEAFIKHRDTLFEAVGEYMERHMKPDQYAEWKLCMSQCNYVLHQYMQEIQRHFRGLERDLVHDPLFKILDTKSPRTKGSGSFLFGISVDDVETYLYSIRTQEGPIQLDQKQYARAMEMLVRWATKYEERRDLVSGRIQTLIERQGITSEQSRIEAGCKLLTKLMVPSGKVPGSGLVDLLRVEFPKDSLALWPLDFIQPTH